MMQLGYNIETRVLTQRTELANQVVATHFGVDTATPVIRIDRLRLTDGIPLAIQRSCLPAERFARLEQADLTGSLYQHLHETYGVIPIRADEVINACLVTDDEQGVELFDVDPNLPCFLMERISFDDAGPVDFSRSLVRSDRYKIRLALRSG